MNRKITYILFVFILALLGVKQAQAQNCPRVLSIFADACSPTNEGYNELFTFQVGTTAINVNNIDIDWPANTFTSFIQNTATASKITTFNNAIIAANGCGRLLQPTGGVLPANAKVVVFTSQNVDPNFISFGALGEDMYVLFQNNTSTTSGYFANNGSSANRSLTLSVSSPSCSQTVTYNRANLAAADGAGITFSASGTPTYFSNGCVAPVNTTNVYASIAVANGSNSSAQVCLGTAITPIVFNIANATGAIASNLPNGVSGAYNSATNTFTLNGTPTATGVFNYKVKTTGGCGVDSIMGTLTVSASVDPTFTQVAAICSGATLAALPTTSINNVTGTWSPALNNTATTTYTFTPTAGQ
ncbi:hypothetical protein [Taibaiella sp. KBW10]|uniref:hypothetical protein n=1 Tax=Taibaiella sp. KBW10 TaxID=2153357 RepID=UPI000F5A9875|nr:hypothetical protein [Taibaiella sp. KBW10]